MTVLIKDWMTYLLMGGEFRIRKTKIQIPIPSFTSCVTRRKLLKLWKPQLWFTINPYNWFFLFWKGKFGLKGVLLTISVCPYHNQCLWQYSPPLVKEAWHTVNDFPLAFLFYNLLFEISPQSWHLLYMNMTCVSWNYCKWCWHSKILCGSC